MITRSRGRFIGHLLRPIYVLQMNAPRMRDSAHDRWLGVLRSACLRTIRDIDHHLDHTLPHHAHVAAGLCPSVAPDPEGDEPNAFCSHEAHEPHEIHETALLYPPHESNGPLMRGRIRWRTEQAATCTCLADEQEQP